MIKKLRLKNFKNFKDVELSLGPFTTLVGANASGKSNIRDAFRFLHGIARGYNLAEIIGEKWGEGGVLQWQGIRGGSREVVLHGAATFILEIETEFEIQTSQKLKNKYKCVYSIEVNRGDINRTPFLLHESLIINKVKIYKYIGSKDKNHLKVEMLRAGTRGKNPPKTEFINSAPILYQLFNDPDTKPKSIRTYARYMLRSISSFRFLDLSPSAMRIPSLPGNVTLGDRGENLSSVLQAICENPAKRETLIDWMRELTPMDAKDFEFPADQTGRVLLTLVEGDNRRTSAYSASDGTLRFLAMIAALLGPENATFYFFEEMENGIHPNRLHLLLNLIEKNVLTNNIQIIATTHSAAMLAYIGSNALNYASLVYRLPDQPYAQIQKIVDIPGARSVIESQDLGRLLASGWLEDAMLFTGAATDGEP